MAVTEKISQKSDLGWIKEIARRRVYIFFSLFMVLAFTPLLKEESDKLLHVMDDIAMVLGALTVLILSFLWKKKNSYQELRKQHLLFTVIFFIVLVFQIAALPLEISDPTDFGNDIPSVILVVLTICNKLF